MKIRHVNLKLEIKISGPMSNSRFGYTAAHFGVMKRYFAKQLKEQNVSEIEWIGSGLAPRASYEIQLFQLEARVVLTEVQRLQSSAEMLTEFVEKFSRSTRGRMHDHVFLEVNKIQTLFPKIVTNHRDIRFSGVAVGNLLNAGVFLNRGDFVELEESKNTTTANFEHDKRVMSLYFEVHNSPMEECFFRMTMFYSQFLKVVVDFSDNTTSIFFHLKSPPQLYEGVCRVRNADNIDICYDWMRVDTWPADCEHRGIGCSTEAITNSTWLRLSFKKNEEDSEAVAPIFIMGILARIAARSNTKIFYGSVFAVRRRLAPSPAIHSLGSFRADYALQALITRGSVFMDQLFDAATTSEGILSLESEPLFLKLVRHAMKECQQAAEECLEQLLNAIDEKRDMEVASAFATIYKTRKNQYERLLSGRNLQEVGLAKPLPNNCVFVAKVIVTPTRVLLMAPEAMMVNRVVRRFGPDYALRCVFRDDNLGKLHIRDFSINGANQYQNAASSAIFRTLRDGIYIAGRQYSFLGWSNSQMRDQGCYFYAPRKDPFTGELSGTVDEIRRWMGDFRGVVSVPKMMSRMGQCFTQAQPTIRLKRKHWVVEDDIENEKYCFSDGCGRISVRVATQIAKLLELNYVPACFQVRFKGIKGIVVIDPMIDQIVNMPKIIFRKSQQKFGEGDGDDDYLEVVKYAMPSPVCFNRPFITVLDHVSEKQSSSSHTRISNRVHYHLERELSSLSNMLLNENQACEELVARTSLPIDWIFASKQSGFQLTVDPFVRQMLISIYRYNIVHHISKSKIFLPPSMGRTMYGVVDETGLLQYGQVFAQYSPSIRQTSNKPILLRGKVLITKNPCLVPGDVRVFEAVWQPSLSHLVDVVVFPQHGPRPHPDEMAGSDLDGDEYSVIWDPEMLLDHNEPAMEYPSAVKVVEDKKKKETTSIDMIQFFLTYMKHDSIGKLCNGHLMYADVHGLFHETCNSIALKCAVAVDFPKSGIPAEPLTRAEQIDESPDYMPTHLKPMYYSPRLNGQLYRKARKLEEILDRHVQQSSMFEGEYDKLLCPDDEDVFFGDEQKLFQTLSIRDEYVGRMQQLLDEYGIEDEASVVSGHAVSIKRLAGMEKDDYSFYHTDKIVELRYEKLYKVYRAKFFEEFGGESAFLTEDGKRAVTTRAMHEKARQWYFVSYVQPRKSKSGKTIGQSLPWVAWEALCDMRRYLMLMKKDTIGSLQYPLSSRLALEMKDSISRNSETFQRFQHLVDTHRDALCIRRYSQVYSNQLVELLFVLHTWLKRENVLPAVSINIWHVGRLLIRFALGELNGNPTIGFEKSMLKTKPIFGAWLNRNKKAEEDKEPLLLELDTGTLMLEFLRYLSSQSFALSTQIPLRVFSGAAIEPSLMRNSQWLPLHHAAHRAFHSLAVSGIFLSLSDGDGVESVVEECRDHILVKEAMFAEGDRVVKALKKWSGVQEIIVRDLPWTFSTAGLLSVGSVGTVLSRQRLSRLLLLNSDTILDAIASGVVPDGVLDCL